MAEPKRYKVPEPPTRQSKTQESRKSYHDTSNPGFLSDYVRHAVTGEKPRIDKRTPTGSAINERNKKLREVMEE